MKRVGVIGLVLVFTAFTAFGDIVLLKDGRSFEGEIVEETDEFVRLLSDGKIKRISHTLIEKISKDETEVTEEEDEIIEEEDEIIEEEVSSTTQEESYNQGLNNGKRDGKEAASVGWLAGGLLCGLFGFLGTLIFVPKPPVEVLIGKSPQYVSGYTKGYKSAARNKNMVYSLIGWAVNIPIFILISSAD